MKCPKKSSMIDRWSFSQSVRQPITEITIIFLLFVSSGPLVNFFTYNFLQLSTACLFGCRCVCFCTWYVLEKNFFWLHLETPGSGGGLFIQMIITDQLIDHFFFSFQIKKKRSNFQSLFWFARVCGFSNEFFSSNSKFVLFLCWIGKFFHLFVTVKSTFSAPKIAFDFWVIMQHLCFLVNFEKISIYSMMAFTCVLESLNIAFQFHFKWKMK